MIFINDRKEPLRARNAVLLYGTGAASYASVHEVSESEEGDLKIEAGTSVTVQALRALFETLNPASKERPVFQGAEIISRGPGWLVWWMRPTVRRVWFESKEIGTKNAEVPHPALVFSVSPRGWRVFALKSNSRPSAVTALFQAPYFNVWGGDGKICVGSAATPEGSAALDPKMWEKAFFESRFTHPNIHDKDGLVKFGAGPTKFWKEMLAGKFKAFPKDVLVPVKLTVEGLLCRIAGEL